MTRCLCTGRTDITCDEEHCDLAGPGDVREECRLCWKRLQRPKTRKGFSLTVCRHMGAATGETAQCASCSLTNEVPVLACLIHGRCTQAKPAKDASITCCRTCPDYSVTEASPLVTDPSPTRLALVTLNLGGVLAASSRASMAAAAKRWGADFVEITEPIAAVGGKPHWQKAFLADHFWAIGYERVVYYDADVLIRSDCPSPFVAVPAGHIGVTTNDQFDGAWKPGEKNIQHGSLALWSVTLGLPCPPIHEHANTGMIVFEPTTHREFFDAWKAAGEKAAWGRLGRLVDQAAFSVLLASRPEARTWLPVQFNLLVFRRDMIRMSGPMQSYVYHFAGDGKKRLHEATWDLRSVTRGDGLLPRRPLASSDFSITHRSRPASKPHTPSSRLLGDVNLRTLVKRTVVISLDRRADRFTDFLAGLPDPWPFAPPTRHRAVDAKLCPPPAWFTHERGQWGARQSHLRAWEDALNDGIESLLVLEDDAAFGEDFAVRVREFLSHVPDDWQLIFLGGGGSARRASQPVPVNEHVIQPGYTILCHAYIVRGQALRDLYRLAHEHTPERAEMDHRIAEYASRNTVGVYAPASGWLVHQAEGHSDITDSHRPTSAGLKREVAHARSR